MEQGRCRSVRRRPTFRDRLGRRRRVREEKGAELLQIRAAEAAAETARQVRRQSLDHPLAVPGACLAQLLELDDATTDEPVGGRHHRVDGASGLLTRLLDQEGDIVAEDAVLDGRRCRRTPRRHHAGAEGKGVWDEAGGPTRGAMRLNPGAGSSLRAGGAAVNRRRPSEVISSSDSASEKAASRPPLVRIVVPGEVDPEDEPRPPLRRTARRAVRDGDHPARRLVADHALATEGSVASTKTLARCK